MPSLKISANKVASLCLHGPKSFHVQLNCTEHRISFIADWDIPEGSKVLELGCGQGDTSAILAEIVGPNGHVTGVDPGALDYGSPYTLGQSQSHLKNGELGSRLTFVRANPLEFLADDTSVSEFDVAVLSLCIWYFHSRELLVDTFRALHKRSKRLLIAEWGLVSSNPAAQPHIYSVLAQAALERHNPDSSANVRTVLSPAEIRAAAQEAGWVFGAEGYVATAENVLDGRWEVNGVLDDYFLNGVRDFVKDAREQSVIVAFRDTMLASLERIGGKEKVASMDVWQASFSKE